ncbi:MAG TPA: class I SAM-dependent methyltransferase [Kiloniellales bacterium]|nr:class I SAM-dependent methyltransferase [Kiloniellales bacterium]
MANREESEVSKGATAPGVADTGILVATEDLPPEPKQRRVVRDRELLRRSMLQRMNRRSRFKGEVLYPCLPALRDEIINRLSAIFTALGKPFNAKETDKMRGLLGQQLEKGYANSGLNGIKVVWWSDAAKDMVLHYKIQIVQRNKAGHYEMWVKNRKPPLFGAHPDARVMDVAATLPAGARIVDLGAGTGRNAIPLAAAGFTVDTVDGTASFVEIIRKAAEEKGVAARINATLSDILPAADPLPAGGHHMVLLSEVVPDMRKLADLRRVFERAERLLAPGGVLLFNAFVTEPEFTPDPLTVELSQYHWCWMLTAANLAEAARGLALELESDLEAFPYERARQPSWPPTGWYDNWSHGNDLFGLPLGDKGPVALRWLTYRRRA